MNSGELFNILQDKLAGSEKVLYIHTGTIVIGGGRSSCVLALVERVVSLKTEFAIFIFSSETSELQLSDLECDQVLPLDSTFRCSFVPPEGSEDLHVRLTDSGGLTVSLEFPANETTDAFIGQIYGVAEKSSELEKTQSGWSRPAAVINAGRSIEPIVEKTLTPAELEQQCQANAKGGSRSQVARDDKIRKIMQDRCNDYTSTQTISVLIATWNVNGQMATVSLVDWLNVDPEPPDIYAIGFQELDLSKEAFLFHDSPREGEWLRAVNNALSLRREKYVKVCLVRLVGMMLIVFVKESHINCVRNVTSDTVGTGLMGKLGNKGGVGVRLDFHSTSICFVNSHLAAHVEEFERRNQDYNEITNRMGFNTPAGRLTIIEHDQIFWLGDLNYRVTELEVSYVKNLLQHKNYQPILLKDQLNIQREKRKVFKGYSEGSIHFHPTYKYDTGTDDWDSSEKNRAPAWCDRILWKGVGIKQINYRSHPSLTISDHKPVSSLFESTVRIIDEKKYRKVQESVIKVMDREENELLPDVKVDRTEILFDNVKFMEQVSQELIVSNTGQVTVQFQFITKPDEHSFCKPWLRVEPSRGVISIADKCDLLITVNIDKDTAHLFNSSQDKLHDILVLHLDGGKDIFISISGNYIRSCFGCSIEALVHVSVPINEISAGKLAELELKKDVDGPEPYPIPKEIWFLVDQLYRHGLKKPLFTQSGLPTEIREIRDWLDNGSIDPLPGSVFSIAEALVLLLESTPEPIVPYHLQKSFLNASSSYPQCRQQIQLLPEHRRNVFLYLCVFLQELLCHSGENELEVKVLAALFGSIFLRDKPVKGEKKDRRTQQDLDRKKCNFVYHFLVNDQTDFILGR